MTSLAHAGSPDEIEPNDFPFPRGGVISRGVIQSAMDLLMRRHGLDDRELAFDIMRRVSQIGNVKLRAVASQLLVRDGADMRSIAAPLESRIPRPPRITFGRAGWSAGINRVAVLSELMHVVRGLANAPRATVQAVDPVNRGLLIERHVGFDRSFLDYFSYLDAAESACGAALVDAEQVVLPDVANSGVYEPDGQTMMLNSGARCVISTPLRDSEHRVVGVVSSHHPIADRLPDQATLNRIQRYADEAGRWLEWHDARIMPVFVDAVHSRAAQHRSA